LTGRFSLVCAVIGLASGVAAGGCRQTWVLDDSSPDGGLPGIGGASGSGGSGPSDASSDGRCPSGQPAPIQFTPDVPQALVLLDRSSMMSATFGAGTQLAAALNAIQSIVSTYGGSHGSRQAIDFSFLDFPDPVASDCNGGNGCCASDPMTIFSDFENANSCTGAGPNGCFETENRPIANALNQAADYFNGQHGSSERYVILVTDGDPQGPCASNGTACSDAQGAKSNNLDSIPVTTEVVAIGGDFPCLREIAASSQVPSPYYNVASQPTDLPYDLQSIAQTISQNGCRLTLTSPTSGNLKVELDMVPQQPDMGTTGNGWNDSVDSNGNTRVFLHGSLCQNFLQLTNPSSPFGLQIFDESCDHFGTQPSPTN
jgi:hypothetical protein